MPDRLLGEIEKTDEFKKVLDALQDDSVNFIFVSGVAGTGKSTLISLATRLPQTNSVVVAPTGIAAMNLGGTTMHAVRGVH